MTEILLLSKKLDSKNLRIYTKKQECYDKKNKILKLVILCIIGLVFYSCNVETDNDVAYDKLNYEMSKLSSQVELDSLITRGDDNIVDWQLSREFAELWLQESIDAGEYPNDSSLWKIPVAIYDS